jgi:hypothetical protein
MSNVQTHQGAEHVPPTQLTAAAGGLGGSWYVHGYLPHYGQEALRTMAEDLAELLERVARESPALGPLGDAEGLDDE